MGKYQVSTNMGDFEVELDRPPTSSDELMKAVEDHIAANGGSLKMQAPTAQPAEEPALVKAGHALINSPGQMRDIVAPATEQSSTVGKVVRPVARAALGTLGAVYAPGAAVGSLIGSGTEAAAKAAGMPNIETGSTPFTPLGWLMKLASGGSSTFGPKELGQTANIGSQMLMPTGVATGGLSLLPKAARNVAEGVGAMNVIKGAGGFKGAITNVAEKALGANVSPLEKAAQTEQAGKNISLAERAGSQLYREAPSAMIEKGIKTVPPDFKITSEFASAVDQAQNPVKAAQTSTQTKVGKLAKEVAPAQGETSWRNLSIGGENIGASIERANPELRDAYLRAVREATGAQGGQVGMEQLDSLRRELSHMQRTVKSDADAKFLASARNAVENDISKIGTQYPEAIQTYRAGIQKYKDEVAPWYAQGAPFRELVEAKQPSEMIGTLEKMPVEHVRNVMSGINRSPYGPDVAATVQKSVMANLFTHAYDSVTGGFKPGEFVKQVSKPETAQKLAEILGPEKYANLQHFTSTMQQTLAHLGAKAEQGSPMLRFMGLYHLARGAQEAAIGLPMAFYQLSAAGLMLMTPKLAGMMATDRAGAQLLAAAMGAKVGNTSQVIARSMDALAKGMGAAQIPTVAARSLSGNNQVQ